MKMRIDKQIKETFQKYMEKANISINQKIGSFNITIGCIVSPKCTEFDEKSEKLIGSWGKTYHLGKIIGVEFSRYHLSRCPNQIKDTVGHEVAHVAAFLYDQHWGHGKPWKKWMRKFGLKPDIFGYFPVYK